MVADTFVKRSGTTDKGRKYEDLNVADLVLDLVLGDNVKDFEISSNVETLGAFDDIAVKLESKTSNTKYAIQLKHCSKATLNCSQLTGNKGDFALNKYQKSFQPGWQLILFTNLKFPGSKETLKINVEGNKTVEFKILKEDKKHELLSNGSYFSFKMENSSSETDKYKIFFDNFLLFTNQKNVDETKKNILNKFHHKLCCSKEDAEKYIAFITEWSGQEGEKVALTKPYMQQVIVLSALSRFIKPISFGNVTEEMKVLREAIDGFDVTFIDQANYDNVKLIWGDEKESALNNSTDIFKKFQFKHRDDTTLSKVLWLMNRSPLIVNDNPIINEVMKLCPDQKFVILRCNSERQALQNCRVFQNLSNLQKSVYENLVKTLKLQIQGKEAITLKTLVEENEEVKFMLTTDELVKISTSVYCIGEAKEPICEPYIDRFLSKNTIDVNFLRTIDNNTVIVLDCRNKLDKIKSVIGNFNLIDISRYLKEEEDRDKENLHEVGSTHSFSYRTTPDLRNFVSGPNIFFSQSVCSKDIFFEICKRNNSTNCHHLRIVDETTLEWIRSKEDPSNLNKYRSNKFVKETELHLQQLDNNVNIVCGDPGMGKSELLKNFKNNCSPELWAVFMSPKDMTVLCDKYKKKLVDFLINDKYKEYFEFDRKVIEFLIENNKVVFFWDAIDEISKIDLEYIIDVIEKLSSQNICQWISSRNHLKEKLEKKLTVLSKIISPFNEDQQNFYLKKRLDINDTEIKQIRSEVMSIIDSDILPIPLHIFRLTELKKSAKKRKVSLPEVYNYIINDRFDRFYTEKAGVNNPNDALKDILSIHRQSMYEKYVDAAVNDVIVKNVSDASNANKENVLPTEVDCLGLLTDGSSQLRPAFAKYFAASYLVAHPDKVKHLDTNFLADTLELQKKMQGDNKETVIFSTEKEGDTYVIDNDDDYFSAIEETNFANLKDEIEELVSNEDLNINILYYSSKYGDEEILGKFNQLPFVKTKRSDSSLLHLAVTCNQEPFLKKLLSVDVYKASVNQKDKLGRTALYKACEHGYYNICLILIESGAQIDIGNDNGSTPLHTACLHNHVNIVELLIKYKCDVNVVKHSNVTPLDVACWNGHLEVVEVLLNNGADINALSGDTTALYLASRNNFDSVVDLLLKTGAEVNLAKAHGHSPLFVASQEGHEKNVKLLLKSEADVNLSTESGETPLYMACQNGHEGVAKVLIESGANVNVATSKGWTALHIAAQKERSKIVRLLIQAGANVNFANAGGKTALDVAKLHGHSGIVQMLEDATLSG